MSEGGFKLIPDDPEDDGTDYAHPAYWRGSEAGVRGATMRMRQAAEGHDDGSGVIGSPELEKVRRMILDLRKKAGGILDITDETEVEG